MGTSSSTTGVVRSPSLTMVFRWSLTCCLAGCRLSKLLVRPNRLLFPAPHPGAARRSMSATVLLANDLHSTCIDKATSPPLSVFTAVHTCVRIVQVADEVSLILL